jgi:hypothetical protein
VRAAAALDDAVDNGFGYGKGVHCLVARPDWR